MAHIFFIDPLEKLNIKKDSTLMMALSFQDAGEECYLLFEEDFYMTNRAKPHFDLYSFSGEFKDDGCYLESFQKTEKVDYQIKQEDVLHMRIDPPYDTRYQRYLWMLEIIKEQSNCLIINDPLKIMKHNEKLVAYKNEAYSHPSYVGSSKRAFENFVKEMSDLGHEELILKPLDLYSGIGVEKVKIDSQLNALFDKKVSEYHGAIVAQPFIKQIYEGEYRSVFFKGEHIGTIIKRPQEGEYLANIAQGAKFEKTDLPKQMFNICQQMADELLKDGVYFLAFDILGEGVNEANITCPGLLVEVSYAHQKNLCLDILKLIKS